MRRSRASTRRPHATHVQILMRLRRLGNPKNAVGMVRFGINPSGTLGISIVDLRKLARDLGADHALAQRLWASGIHEARILASFIDDPRLVTAAQMDRWVAAFDSWDVCDQVCALFEQTRWARTKITAWAGDDREFVKRASFAMIAGLAVHDMALHNRDFETFLRLIKARCHRRPEFRPHSRELGPAEHRQTQSGAESTGGRRRSGPQPTRLVSRALGRHRRAERTHEQEGRGPVAPRLISS